MAAEINQIKEKQERLVDSDGVDLRVKPVIESVMDIKSQVSDIHNYFMNREPNERSGDRK
jgi:deoxycytidine triphosphate deaminase